MPKSARRTTDNVFTMPRGEIAAAVEIASAVSHDDIARRAFDLHCDRGRQDGYDLDDWLTAERELHGAASAPA